MLRGEFSGEKIAEIFLQFPFKLDLRDFFALSQVFHPREERKMNGIKFKRPEGSKRNEFCVKNLPKAATFLSGADGKLRASHLRDADDSLQIFQRKTFSSFRGCDIMLSTGSIVNTRI